MSYLDIIGLLRPRQWVKNVFVVLPLFFSGGLFVWQLWIPALVAALAFCFAASGVYCFNDIMDCRADRLHPVKAARPVASGRVSVTIARGVMGGCLIVAGLLCVLLDKLEMVGLGGKGGDTGLVIAGYVVLNYAYSRYIKRIAIVDVFTLALGFVLRLFAGAFACCIWLSPWIVSLTFLLALFLAFAKRRDDVIMNEQGGVVTRRNTLTYNRTYLDLTLGVLCAVTIVCYVMYCMSPEVVERLGSEYVYTTAVFVLLGMLRYMQLAIVENRSGAPTEIILRDGMMRFSLIGWIVSFGAILYF